jgi:CBS domain-containing protein
MLVKDIMRQPVITVSQEATLREAIALLSIHGISGLPVVDSEGRLIGIATEHDIIKAMLPTYQELAETEAAMVTPTLMETHILAVQDNPVSSIMTRKVVTLAETDTILKAASTAVLNRVKRLPVVREGKPVGIVSRIDIVKAIMEGGFNRG